MKTLYSVGLALLLTSAGNAQILKSIGIKSGVTVSQLKWEIRQNSMFPTETLKSKRTIGYFFQIISDIVETDKWLVNSSFGFLQKNGVYNNPFFVGNQFGTEEVYYRLNYLSFTNLAIRKVKLNNVVSFRVYLGPRIDYLVGHSDNVVNFNSGYFFYIASDDDLKKINIGLNTGIGFNFEIRKFTLGIEASRNFNFNQVMSAKGPRADGYGDEGFSFNLTDKTYILNLAARFKLR